MSNARSHPYRLRLGLVGLPLVMFRVPQLGEYLSRMAARVEMIGMGDGLTFASLLTTVTGEDMLVVVVVEMLVLVAVRLGHSSHSWFLRYVAGKQVADVRRKMNGIQIDARSTTARPNDRFDTG